MNDLISIITPVYNESQNLPNLFQSIISNCGHLDFELIAIDDGSSDDSHHQLQSIATTDKRIRIFKLKRNFGQTAALAAGIDHAKGTVIVPIDADGQNDPADIPALIAKLEEGYDVVSGWRRDRKDNALFRVLPSKIANKLISWVTGVCLHDYGCSLKAYRRSVLADIQLYGEMHRFLPAWCVWQGGRVTEIPVKHHPRIHGKSNYGIIRTFKVIIDLITIKFFSGYLAKPSHLFSGTGFVFLLLGLVSAGVALVDKLGADQYAKLRIPLLLLAVFFGLGAIFLVLLGLLAELLVRLYFQIREQKPYRLSDE